MFVYMEQAIQSQTVQSKDILVQLFQSHYISIWDSSVLKNLVRDNSDQDISISHQVITGCLKAY